MKKENKVGTLITESINKEDIPAIKSPDFALVYCPDCEGTSKIFWAQRMSRILLFSFIGKDEMDVVDVSRLKKITFKDEVTGDRYPIEWAQWQEILAAGNLLDTEESVQVEIVNNRAKITKTKTINEDELWVKIAHGFPSARVAKKAIETLGYEIKKKGQTPRQAVHL